MDDPTDPQSHKRLRVQGYTFDSVRGTRIREDMLVAKRPGHGVSPEHHDLVVGRVVAVDIAEDQVLTWDLLLGPDEGD